MFQQFVSTARSQHRQPGSSLGSAAVSKIVVKLLPRLCAVPVIVLAALMAPVAHAVDVFLTTSNSNTGVSNSSFITSTGWSPAIAPSTGNNYFASAGFRTPDNTTSYVFGGDSLTMNPGASLVLNNTGRIITVDNWIFAGGTIGYGSTGTITLAGNITFTANTTSQFNTEDGNRTMVITAPISGSGNLHVRNRLGPTGNLTLSAANTFTGTTEFGTNTPRLRLGNLLALQNSALTATNNGIVSLDAGAGTYVFGGFAGTRDLSTVITGNATNMQTLQLNPLSGTVAYSGNITNLSAGMALTKTGNGTQELSGTNTYSGATSITGGTLRVNGSGSINSTSGITINGGQLDYNSSTPLTAGLTFTNGTLGGTEWTGSSLNNLTIGANMAISPGNSPGTANTVNQTWDEDGSYVFEINSAAGVAGNATAGWDLLAGTGTLSITATSGNPFVIDLTSLDTSNDPNPVFDFNQAQGYEWLIADFANPVSGFSSSAFFVNDTNFDNAYAGTFGVVLGTSVTGGDDTQLYLTYVPVPEPSAVLLAGLAGVGMVALRRRTIASRARKSRA
jgi:autotransporter-associated beta strand protein